MKLEFQKMLPKYLFDTHFGWISAGSVHFLLVGDSMLWFFWQKISLRASFTFFKDDDFMYMYMTNLSSVSTSFESSSIGLNGSTDRLANVSVTSSNAFQVFQAVFLPLLWKANVKG